MSGECILIVDDDPQLLRVLAKYLSEEGYKTLSARNALEATVAVRREAPALVLLDVRLPDANGLVFLKERLQPEMGPHRVIIMTGHGTLEDAHEAVSHGAYDYVTKPIALPRLGITIRNCLRLLALDQEVKARRSAATRAVSLRDLVGASPQMVALIERIKRVATFDVPVLILGESGTGKELVAQAIHTLSGRNKGPFVPVDCGALPESLVEAEVFGYERGAFSGAVQAKPGKLEQAHGGTLFLDEMGNVPLAIQAKLLRVLQSYTVERLGGRKVMPVDLRLISATNANLDGMVEEGRFRRDLFHRLNVVVLTVPSLRERQGDISLLAHYTLMVATRDYKKPVSGISSEAMTLLEGYPWPGNVRELENCIRSAVILADKIALPDHLPLHIRRNTRESLSRSEAPPLIGGRQGKTLRLIRRQAADEAERGALVQLLEETGWNKAETARRLGVDYKTLYVKLRYHGVQRSPKVSGEGPQ